mmetsp:Transcript_3472/g.10760  ORF Transcript_3472/g.10760 Transcript_3472/m.10760 type:complete len:459 (+) Transcript_3472:317-1693(+)
MTTKCHRSRGAGGVVGTCVLTHTLRPPHDRGPAVVGNCPHQSGHGLWLWDAHHLNWGVGQCRAERTGCWLIRRQLGSCDPKSRVRSIVATVCTTATAPVDVARASGSAASVATARGTAGDAGVVACNIAGDIARSTVLGTTTSGRGARVAAVTGSTGCGSTVAIALGAATATATATAVGTRWNVPTRLPQRVVTGVGTGDHLLREQLEKAGSGHLELKGGVSIGVEPQERHRDPSKPVQENSEAGPHSRRTDITQGDALPWRVDGSEGQHLSEQLADLFATAKCTRLELFDDGRNIEGRCVRQDAKAICQSAEQLAIVKLQGQTWYASPISEHETVPKRGRQDLNKLHANVLDHRLGNRRPHEPKGVSVDHHIQLVQRRAERCRLWVELDGAPVIHLGRGVHGNTNVCGKVVAERAVGAAVPTLPRRNCFRVHVRPVNFVIVAGADLGRAVGRIISAR